MADSHEPSVDSINADRGRTRLLFLLAAIACVLILAGIWINKKMDEMSVALLLGDPGAVTTSDKWPRVLTEFVESAKQSGIAIEDLEVHCFQSGWDEEFLWRMKSNPALLDFVKKHHQLQDAAVHKRSIFTNKPRPFMSEREIPAWALPDLKDCEYFTSPGFMEGEGDDNFEMVHDTKHGVIVVLYYFDF